MCTASWLLEKNGYQVFFNRDEQIGRAKAHPPTEFVTHDGIRFVMPVDPVGKGSWIATNEFGLTLCLLNYYQGELPGGALISRGQLVKKFAHYSGSKALFAEFSSLSLEHYAPFTLVIFDSQLCSTQGNVIALQWNGKALLNTQPLPPLISSAVDADNVTASRQRLFAELNTVKGPTAASRLAFHHSHAPEKGHLSPCMHREEAHTVSFTHIITKESTTIYYRDGSPCSQTPYHKNSLPKAATNDLIQS